MLWLTGSRIRGLDDTDAIATWPDSSRRQHDADQATGADQPLYTALMVNNKPGARFDGTDDWMSVENHSDFIIDANQDISIMFVVDDLDSGVLGWWMTKLNSIADNIANAGAVGFDILRVSANDVHFRIDDNTTQVILASSSNVPSGAFVLSCLLDRDSATGQEILFDGVSQGTADPTSVGDLSTADQPLSVMGTKTGSASFAPNTDLLEVLFFNRLLGATEHNRLGRYFARRYNLTWTDVP